MCDRLALILLSGVLVATGVGCAPRQSQPPAPVVASASFSALADIDLLEAVYRHQIATNASGQQRNAGVYCLELIEPRGVSSDPPPKLMARFAGATPPIVPVSQCRIGSDMDGNRVTHVATGRSGLIVKISSAICPRSAHCVVEGGYYEANLSASGNSYVVERSRGTWQVTRDMLNVIS